MKFVILLGALALLALSSTAEDQDKAIDLAGKDILIREVRDAESKKKIKTGKQKKTGKGFTKRERPNKTNRKENNSPKNKKGKRQGRRQRNKEGKKKRRMRNRAQKKRKSPSRKGSDRQTSDNCDAFYNKLDTAAVRDFRYARNQIQKARRAKKRIEKLDRLTLKAATAFLEGAAFYQACDAPGAWEVYEGLSQCNVTAANACNPADLKNTTDYADIDLCITALETTINSSENCLSKGECGTGVMGDGTCSYKPIGMVNRTCDYVKFEQDVAKLLNKNCSSSTFVGSFTYCNNLLKDSYPIASNCICPLTMTTLAPSSGRLRNNLNIWKI